MQPTDDRSFIPKNEIVPLQTILLNYNEKNIEDTIEAINQTKFLRSMAGLRSLVKEITELFMMRPKKFTEIAKLCVELNLHSSAFKNVLLGKLFHSARRNADKISNYKLLVELYYLNFFTLDELKAYIAKFPKKYENQYFLLIVSFIRELFNDNREQGNKYLDECDKMKFLAPVSREFFNKTLKEYWRGKYQYNADRYAPITQLVRHGFLEGTVPYMIKYDLIEQFEEYVFRNPIDLNDTIKPSLFEPIELAHHEPSLISFAALYNSENIFNYLVKQRVKVRKPDLIGTTIQQFAAAGVCMAAKKWLVIHRESWDNALMPATLARQEVMFDFIVQQNAKQDLDQVLYAAAEYNNLYALQYCIKNGANIEMVDSVDHQTCLHKAAENGNTMICEVLLEQSGINLNPQDIRGRTPLHLAAEFGHIEIVRKLLKTPGVNPDIKDEYGCTAFDLAQP